jgi:1-acyl-sn-glycerol-3-phosphate acyltransferase
VPVAFANTENIARSLKRLQRPKITIRVGEPFRLAPFNGGSHKEQLREDTDRIMCHIAALLPPEYHGAYAGHPYLKRGSPAPEVPGGSP